MSDYVIRNYCREDAEKIGKFDKIAELSYSYNGAFKAENIFCAVNQKNEVLGTADLEPHTSWTPIDKDNQEPDYVYNLFVNLRINPEYSGDEELCSSLINTILHRAREIKKHYPRKKIRVIRYIPSSETKMMDFYISHGFCVYNTILVLKYDLTKDIKSYPCNSDVKIVNWKMESEIEVKQYFETDEKSNKGAAFNIDTVRWMRFSPEWATFGAFVGDEFIGGVMTYSLGEDRSATENIFVLPKWRRKGVAKAFITEALMFLKNNEKKIATLAVYGSNKPAISLYTSLGYRMYYILNEYAYDL